MKLRPRRGDAASQRRGRRRGDNGAGRLRDGGVEIAEVAMYERYYGLQERPFDLSPNPRFLCFTRTAPRSPGAPRYGLAGARASRCWSAKPAPERRRSCARRCRCRAASRPIVHLSNPTLTRAEFYEYPGGRIRLRRRGWQVEDRVPARAGGALDDAVRPRLALVVDEAQSVPYELLEEIRLLTNAEAATGRSLAVALVGQPELARRLDEARCAN